jgi:aryl-alcohol dehydrogenase-like predicted oxidoreductase
MKQRPLGKTGIMVSPLGFGAAGLAGPEEASAGVLLNAALDGGCTIIDTAECYNLSEETIGKYVGHRRKEYALFTKFGHNGSDFGHTDWDPRIVQPSIDRSLKRLRTDRIDLIQIHTCDLATLKKGDLITEMRRARDAGKCRFIGFSGDREEARWAVESGIFDTIQTSISIADQEAIDRTLPEARRRGMGIIIKRPVANGVWTFPADKPPREGIQSYWRRVLALDYPFLKTARASEVVMRFPISVEGVATTLVGSKKLDRWKEYQAAAEKDALPTAEYEAIRSRWKQVAKPDWTGET